MATAIGAGAGATAAGGYRRWHYSDVNLKHDIVPVGHLANGLGLYRFSYTDSDKVYVGVLAQEVERVMPDAVRRAPNGYLQVDYERVGVPMMTWDEWVEAGQRQPALDGHLTEPAHKGAAPSRSLRGDMMTTAAGRPAAVVCSAQLRKRIAQRAEAFVDAVFGPSYATRRTCLPASARSRTASTRACVDPLHPFK